MSPRRNPVDIDVFHCPLAGANLIEASAGTGKTWTLSALYLRCVLEAGRGVGEILVVTYTKAATAELRERIRARLAETLLAIEGEAAGASHAGDPFVRDLLAALSARGIDRETMALRLKLALAEFDQAAIFTIHSFCQRALGDAPIAGNVPLVLELVPDDAELLARAVADAWRKHIGGAPLSRELAGYLVEHPLTPETVVPLLKRRRAKPLATEIWPEAQAARGDLARFRAEFAALRTQWPAWRDEARALILAACKRLSQTYYKPEPVEEAIVEWDLWLAADATLAAQPPASKRLVLLMRENLLLRATGKVKEPPEHACFDAAQTVLDGWNAVAGDLDTEWRALLKRMLDDAEAALASDKRQRRVAGYDDLLRNLHHALHEDPERAETLAAELRRRFPVALIDEFQDTDPQQWEIFSRVWVARPSPLAGEGLGRGGAADVTTAFVDEARRRPHPLPSPPLEGEGAAVAGGGGDLFAYGSPRRGEGRGDASASDTFALFLVGDPKQAIYRFRHADVHTYLAARERCTTEYTLSQNQRSRPAMIAAVNALFGRNPAAFMRDGLAFHAAGVGAKPRPAWQAPAAMSDALRVWLLPQSGDGWMNYNEAVEAAVNASASEIARLIREGAAGAIRIGERGLKPADIAVLVRSHAQARRMRATLAAAGVDSVELAQESVYRSREAAEVGIVLAAIAEPQDERALRAALATELVGLTAGDIAALEDTAADEFSGHVERFLHYRELWRGRGFAPMWRALLAAERAVPRLLARPDGERRLTNLLHLGELLQAEPLPAGDAFLRWYGEQRQASGDNEEAALRLESDRDLVQIVTVHKSKGLEYPVVFCPLLWAATKAGDDGLIAGEEYRDGETSIVDFRNDAEVAETAKAAAKREKAEEDLRLFYVALTRAVHRCYLVGGVYAKPTRGAPSTKESRKRLLNWLVAGSGIAPDEWLEKDPTQGEGTIENAWRALAGADIVVEELPRLSPPALADIRPDAATLAVRPWTRTLAESWRIGSFSGLMRNSVAIETPAADRDELLALVEPDAGYEAVPAAAINDDDILRFPRGPMAGECLHAVFEHADFTREESWPKAIGAALRRFPLVDEATAESRLAAMAMQMLRDVTATELTAGGPQEVPLGGVRLAELPPAKRLNELSFTFPAHVNRGRLAAELARLGYPLPTLLPGTLDGYLSGFIDLVFEAAGKFYVLDWKSNHLGDTPADYAPPRLAAAMHEHGYHLQALIYAVAVHRYLQARLPGYDYETHFGGVLYLFVRGVRPGWEVGGSPCGVHTSRPSRETLEAIEAMLTQSQQSAAGWLIDRARAGTHTKGDIDRDIAAERDGWRET